MRIQAKIADTFSPYLDERPLTEFFDDLSKRGSTAFALAISLNIAVLFALSAHITLPPPIDEPDVIPIQIITIAAPEAPETDPAPQPEQLPQATPQAAPPQPAVQTAPPPPPPQPSPAPEPSQEPVFVPPPPPEILATPEQVPDAEAAPSLVSEEMRELARQRMQDRFEQQNRPPEPEPLPEPIIPEPVVIETPPEIIPEPLPEIEIFEPVPEPLPEPLPEFEIFEPLPEPILEPILEPDPLPVPEIEIFEPLPEPIIEPPFITPDPVIEPVIEQALPGVVTDLPQQPELPPLPITQPSPDPIVIEAPPVIEPSEPDIIEPEEEDLPVQTSPIIRDAPRILADDAAPETDTERERAVPQSQADTGARPAGGGGAYQAPRISGGGAGAPIVPNIGGLPAPGGTGGRPNPGSGGWSLAPDAYGETGGTGLPGIQLDIRCREAGRTHLDCPEYIRSITGRAPDGSESLGVHSNSRIGGTSLATESGRARTGTSQHNPAVGGSVPYGEWGSNLGGPTTSVIDDADFGREFRSNQIGGGTSADQGRRVRDLIGSQPALPAPTLDPTTIVTDEVDPWAIETLPQQ